MINVLEVLLENKVCQECDILALYHGPKQISTLYKMWQLFCLSRRLIGFIFHCQSVCVNFVVYAQTTVAVTILFMSMLFYSGSTHSENCANNNYDCVLIRKSQNAKQLHKRDSENDTPCVYFLHQAATINRD